jgi:transcriptional regulator with XRE-family HTH domain
MDDVKLEELGRLVARKRGSMGIRAAAAEVGISAATLSRIERGGVPDFQTLTRVCTWLGIDAGAVVGGRRTAVQVAFKKDQAVSPPTAQALAKLILAAHKAFSEEVEAEGH